LELWHCLSWWKNPQAGRLGRQMENGSHVADPRGVGQVRRAKWMETEIDPRRATHANGHGDRARPEVRIEDPEVPEQAVASQASRRTPEEEQEEISDVVSRQ
jgi:hypothetical protein